MRSSCLFFKLLLSPLQAFNKSPPFYGLTSSYELPPLGNISEAYKLVIQMVKSPTTRSTISKVSKNFYTTSLHTTIFTLVSFLARQLKSFLRRSKVTNYADEVSEKSMSKDFPRDINAML